MNTFPVFRLDDMCQNIIKGQRHEYEMAEAIPPYNSTKTSYFVHDFAILHLVRESGTRPNRHEVSSDGGS
jgi:hypothetical protein